MNKVGFAIVTFLTLALMLCVLELNKNTISGFVLALVLAAGYIIFFIKVVGPTHWYLRLGAWLLWTGLFIGILFLTWPPTRRVPASADRNAAKTDTVTVAQGELRGVKLPSGVELYAGVPYAKPPVGELRWREPQDPEPWEGVFEAVSFAPMGMQPTHIPLYDSLRQIIGYHDYEIRLDDNYVPPVSEDSLYLNIWRPEGNKSGLPVLFYIHGGSLQTGQPWFGDYSGEGLAKRDVIVVNVGYRLGVFGFFANEELAAESEHGTTGNYGLLDQIKALEWVRDNISAFGGDPDNVTISGESAGSACVSALCASPAASGLFRRAIMESSTVASIAPPHSYRTYDEAIESGHELMERYSCRSMDELRAVPAEKLVNEAYTQHHITVDGYVLELSPYEAYMSGFHNEEAALHGCNSGESGPFIIFDNANLKNFEGKVRDYFKDEADSVLALYPVSTDAEARDAWAEIWGAIFFDHPHYRLARLEAANGVPVYQYFFTRQNGRLGPWHSGEEIYFYANIPDDSGLFNARDRELSEQMASYFVNFIRSGDPNGADSNGTPLPLWEVNSSSERLMEFGDTTGMIDERRLALFEILDRTDLPERTEEGD